jgi:hypothetical protein
MFQDILDEPDEYDLSEQDIRMLKRYQKEHPRKAKKTAEIESEEEESGPPKRPKKWDVQTKKYFENAYQGNARLERILSKALSASEDMRYTLGDLEKMVFH